MEPAMSAAQRRPALATGLIATLLILAVSAPAAAAVPPPNAAFTVLVDGQTASFRDTSTGAPTSWSWDFGDGTTAATQNPAHAYSPGRYTVTLTVSNDGGEDSATHHVTIRQQPPDQLYARNLYSSQVRYQNPDLTACVATSTMIMLNEVAANGHKGSGFRWVTSTALSKQRAIMRWARVRDTLEPGPGGTDPNGWRNALNWYGWGDYAHPEAMTYQVFAYGTYADAVKQAVIAIARYRRPVGMLGWAGGHAQVINGYTVFGQDPASSSQFTVVSINLTDPLKRDALRNVRLTYSQLASGSLKYRFRRYRQTDSPKDDPYMPGIVAADRGWYNRWVIVAPVR